LTNLLAGMARWQSIQGENQKQKTKPESE